MAVSSKCEMRYAFTLHTGIGAPSTYFTYLPLPTPLPILFIFIIFVSLFSFHGGYAAQAKNKETHKQAKHPLLFCIDR
jgi:hypothetical protein